MPKSQFDPQLKLRAELIHGEGPFVADPPAARGSGPRSVVCWLVEQDGEIAFGCDEASGGDRWHADGRDNPALHDGAARAIGVVLTLDDSGPQAFTWAQDVSLKRE